jgi:hypothetical protein
MSSQFTTPVVTEMQVIPVAGHDSMLMNLSGAHAPFFTRNIVIIKDNSGHLMRGLPLIPTVHGCLMKPFLYAKG